MNCRGSDSNESVGYEVISAVGLQMFCQKCGTSHALTFFNDTLVTLDYGLECMAAVPKEEHFLHLILQT